MLLWVILSACGFGAYLHRQKLLWFIMHVRHYIFDVFGLILLLIAYLKGVRVCFDFVLRVLALCIHVVVVCAHILLDIRSHVRPVGMLFGKWCEALLLFENFSASRRLNSTPLPYTCGFGVHFADFDRSGRRRSA